MKGFEQEQTSPGIMDIIIGRTDPKRYSIESILMTTYTFEAAEITKLMTGLAANGLCTISRLPDTAVYYHEMTSDGSRLIDGESFIRMGNKMENRAFHPKITLLRLEKKAENTREADGEDLPENKYLLIVSSKNITRSDHLEAYAVLEGTETPAAQNTAQNNGKELLDFIRRLTEIAQIQPPQDWSCLENVDFRAEQHPDATVQFVTAEHLGKELRNLSNITVVSPFLGNQIQKYKYDICAILSTEAFPLLHAKIYCGLDKTGNAENTVLIIGSSNATYRGGLSEDGKGVNCEFNVKLCFEGKEMYGEFNEDLNTDLYFSTEEQTAAEQKENLIGHFTKFTKGLEITALENNTATFSANLPADSSCKFSINNTEIDSSSSTVEIALSNFFSAEVKVESKETGNSQIFYLDLLSICKTSSICDKLRQKQQDSIKANRTKYSEMCIESVINGRSPAKALQELEKKETSAENDPKSSRAVSRDHIYEKLMKLARLSGSKDAFAERLRQINRLSIEETEWAKASAELIAKIEAEQTASKGEQE